MILSPSHEDEDEKRYNRSEIKQLELQIDNDTVES